MLGGMALGIVCAGRGAGNDDLRKILLFPNLHRLLGDIGRAQSADRARHGLWQDIGLHLDLHVRLGKASQDQAICDDLLLHILGEVEIGRAYDLLTFPGLSLDHLELRL